MFNQFSKLIFVSCFLIIVLAIAGCTNQEPTKLITGSPSLTSDKSLTQHTPDNTSPIKTPQPDPASSAISPSSQTPDVVSTTTLEPSITPITRATNISTPIHSSPNASTATPLGTPLPTAGAVITTENAKDLTELFRLGRGFLRDMVWSADGKLLAVASTAGIQYYDTKTLSEVNWIDIDHPVDAIIFSPDGTKIYSSGKDDNRIDIWQVSDGTFLQKFRGGRYGISSLTLTPDGSTLITGNIDISVWRTSDGARSTMPRSKYSSTCMTLSPNGSILATCAYDGIYLWQFPDWDLLGKLNQNYTNQLTFSQDGSLLAAVEEANSKYRINIIRVSDRSIVKTIPIDAVWINSFDFSFDGSILAVGTERNTTLWQIPEGKYLRTLQGPSKEWVDTVAFSPDGELLATGSSNHTIRIWRVSDWSLVKKNDGNATEIQSIAFSPNGHILAAAGGLQENNIRIWQMSDGRLIQVLTGHGGMINSIDFSPNGEFLASGSDDGKIKLWRMPEGHPERTINTSSYVQEVAFSPDGKYILGALSNSQVSLWQTINGQRVFTIQGRFEDGPDEILESMAISPDGNRLALGYFGGIIRLWNISDGSLLRTMEGHTDQISSMVFSPDGVILASGSWDETIRLWSVEEGSLQKILYGRMGTIRSLEFSPDGSIIAAGGDYSSIRLWDRAGGVYLQALQPPGVTLTYYLRTGNFASWVESITFSPDGKLLASASGDSTIRLWSVP